VPMPAGHLGCTFDAGLTLQGGVLIAAGPPAAAGQQYPVALVLRCLSPGGICTDSYLAVYNYSTATRALRCVMNKVALQEVCRHCCITDPTEESVLLAMKCHALVNMDRSCTLQVCAQCAPADAALVRQLCRLPRPCGICTTLLR
jgi:hypothetical protein